MVLEVMRLKVISYLELCQPFCSMKCNHLCNLSRESYEEQFCEIILNFGLWFRRRCSLKDFLSGALVPPYSVEQKCILF